MTRMAVPATFVDTVESAFTVRVDSSCDELARLAAPWQRLAGAGAEPMQEHAWSLAAALAFHRAARLRIVTVWRGNSLAAVAPLVEVRRAGLRVLEIIGARFLGEPAKLLADAPDSRERLLRALTEQHLPLRLARVDAHELTPGLRANKGGGVLLAVPGASCLRVDLAGDWESYSAGRSGRRMETLKRRRRQLGTLGPVEFEARLPSPAESDAVLGEAFEVEARGWKGKGGSAVLARPAMRAFFFEVGRAFAADGRLLVRRLRVAGETIAVHVGLVQAQRCWGLKIGYDERFARHSPGMLLLLECLQDGFRRGLVAHEFLGAAAEWQQPFATSERPLEAIAFYPLAPGGLGVLGLDVAGAVGRRIAQLLRI